MKIVTVVGARPQLVKAAAVSRAMAASESITEVLVHTGQHFSPGMSEVFFREMEIPAPRYNLGIHSMPHGAMTGRMLEQLEEVLMKEKPHYLVVYGDTNSTIAGALAAKKLFIKVVHVEAGLRSHNLRMPEEINRILTDRISDILFCPTDAAVENLRNEGFGRFDCKIEKPGDVMHDAALYYSKQSATRSAVMKSLGPSPFILCTLHRQENTDDPVRLRALWTGLDAIHKKVRVVVPLHPRTRKAMEKLNIATTVQLIDPVGYFDILEMLKHCVLVMTDSGGLQKEAYFFSKKCITLREETEWVELVDHGCNMLAGGDPAGLAGLFGTMMERECDFSKDLYGNGRACERIVRYLELNH